MLEYLQVVLDSLLDSNTTREMWYLANAASRGDNKIEMVFKLNPTSLYHFPPLSQPICPRILAICFSA